MPKLKFEDIEYHGIKLGSLEDAEVFLSVLRDEISRLRARVAKRDHETRAKVLETLKDFANTQKDMPPEFQKMLDDNFWDLFGV